MVFVFDELEDAIRWSGNMDWSFNTQMGSGKISVVEVNDTEDWEADDADPLGQSMSKGKWFKRQKKVSPDSIGEATPITMELLKTLR